MKTGRRQGRCLGSVDRNKGSSRRHEMEVNSKESPLPSGLMPFQVVSPEEAAGTGGSNATETHATHTDIHTRLIKHTT